MKTILVLFLEHGFHDAAQVEVNELLVGREELEAGTRVDQLKARDLANVVVLKYVISLVLALVFRQVRAVCIQCEHTCRFNLRNGILSRILLELQLGS